MPGPDYPGIDRIEARFFGSAYARHRHDTYALGVTMRGVQTFWYRGRERASLPGQVIILHPDEVHDGGAGTEAGLIYRMLYIEPALVAASLGSSFSGLPFVKEPVVDDTLLGGALLTILGDMNGEIDPMDADQFSAELADWLVRHTGSFRARKAMLDVSALERARDFLDAAEADTVRSEQLEAVSGLDRFTLHRQFKALFATSPHRYLIMRRVARARRLLAAGQAIADVAIETGFVDQSHLHRHFVRAFGVTPGRWQQLVASAHP